VDTLQILVNAKERAVIILLTAALLAGAGIAQYKQARLMRSRPTVSVRAPSASSAPSVPGPIDLNQATRPQLEALPGIGPVLAGRIIEYRQRHGGFRNINELRVVPGIGPKRYASLKDLVAVGSSGPGAATDSGR